MLHTAIRVSSTVFKNTFKKYKYSGHVEYDVSEVNQNTLVFADLQTE